MQLNALQRFEQARAIAQQKNNVSRTTPSASPAPQTPSIQDLIKNKQKELGLSAKNIAPESSAIPSTYGRSGKVQSTFAPTQTIQKPLGNHLDLVG